MKEAAKLSTAMTAETLVGSGRDSDFATGSAGDRSGACCMQHGCWFPQGIVAGGRVANTTGTANLRVCGQQSCRCAVEALVSVEREDLNARDAAAGAMLQQIVEATISAATILFCMNSATLE